jgi:23S rRNA (uracil1939-C5)-methyltransferase
MLAVGQFHEVTIEKTNHQCEGLVRLEGLVVFVPYALPGEVVKIEITEVKKNIAFANLKKVLTPSPQRVVPSCEYFYRCGGCQIQTMSYAAQIQIKSALLQEQLQTLQTQFEYREFVPSPAPMHYRYRSFIPVSMQPSNILAGYYAAGSHNIVDLNHCPQLEPGLDALYAKSKKFLIEGNFKKIPLRHILVLSSYPAKTYQLVFVWLESDFPEKKNLTRQLLAAFPDVSLGFNYQTNPNNVIMGQHWEWLQGDSELSNQFGDLEFLSSLKAFSQVNPAIAEKIYGTIQNAVENLPPQDLLIDLYGGSGVLSKMLSAHFEQVWVVEENKHSVTLGQKYFALAKFINQTVEKFLEKYQLAKTKAVFIINPPRKGCSSETLEQLLRIKPQYLFYISCNPASLVRDLKILKDQYQVQWVQGFDMFPQTHHFETLVMMRQNQADD